MRLYKVFGALGAAFALVLTTWLVIGHYHNAGSPPITMGLSGAQTGGTPVATGDPRHVTEPSIPATCAVVPANLPAPSGGRFSGGQESAPPDTQRIQAALSKCVNSGRAVELQAHGGNNAFLSAPLTVGAGETLLVDSGVTLYASTNPASYQASDDSTKCGTIGGDGNGCNAFITVNGANAGVMGGKGGSWGTIDGRGNQPMLGTGKTWWQLAQDAKAVNKKSSAQNNPKLITATGNNFTLYNIQLANSPFYHVSFKGASGFTAWGVRINTPLLARNSDGIDPNGASNITITHSNITTSDDCIALKAGNGPVSNVTISDNTCTHTHGISIGSETNAGVSNVLVVNDTINGSDGTGVSTSNNGIRIKSDASRGGTVKQVTYANICLAGVKHLLYFDTHYSTSSGSKIPVFNDILVDGVKSVNSASSADTVFDGYDAQHPLGITLENIALDAAKKMTADYANVAVYNSNVTPSGTGVKVSNFTGNGSVPSCNGGTATPSGPAPGGDQRPQPPAPPAPAPSPTQAAMGRGPISRPIIGSTAGSLSVVGTPNPNNQWDYSIQNIVVRATQPLTAMTVTEHIQPGHHGPTNDKTFESDPGDFTYSSHSDASGNITFTWTLKAGVVLQPGKYTFGAGYYHDPNRDYTHDTYTVTGVERGTSRSQTLNGNIS